MRSLAVSLSSCIYQCLCDSDSFYVNLARAAEPGQEGFIGFVSACHCSFYSHSFCTLLMCAWYKKKKRKKRVHVVFHFVCSIMLSGTCCKVPIFRQTACVETVLFVDAFSACKPLLHCALYPQENVQFFFLLENFQHLSYHQMCAVAGHKYVIDFARSLV